MAKILFEIIQIFLLILLRLLKSFFPSLANAPSLNLQKTVFKSARRFSCLNHLKKKKGVCKSIAYPILPIISQSPAIASAMEYVIHGQIIPERGFSPRLALYCERS
jgi:hypothetical protein